MKNLTLTPFTTDLSDYFDWINEKDGITKAINSYHSMTKPPVSHKHSKHKIQINSIFFFTSFFL
jgi:hypothetical protein